MFSTSTRSAAAEDGATYELDPDEPASMGIVRAVTSVSERSSAAEDGDGETLPPLFETVDPEALDDLVTSRRDGQRSTVEVTFEYAGHTVTVQETEPVTVSVE